MDAVLRGNGWFDCLFIVNFSLVFAEAVDRYPFPAEAQRQQFQGLISELRCLVCAESEFGGFECRFG